MLNCPHKKVLFFKIVVLVILLFIAFIAFSSSQIKPEFNSGAEADLSSPKPVNQEITNLPVVLKGGIQDYFPLGSDDVKLFEVTATNNEDIGKTEAVMCNLGKTSIGGSEGYIQTLFIDGLEYLRVVCVLKKNQALITGCIYTGEERATCVPPMTVFRYPPKKGDKWLNKENQLFLPTTYTVEGEEVLNLPIGNVKATKLRYVIDCGANDKQTIDEWYAPGLGVVKMNRKRTEKDRVTYLTLELKGYRINGKTAGAPVPDKYITQRFPDYDTNPMLTQIKEYLPSDDMLVYCFEEYDPTAVSPEKKKNIYRAKGMRIIDGREMISFVSEREDLDYISSEELCYVDGDTVYRISRCMYEKEEMVPVLKFPLKPGKTWEYNGKKSKETFTVKGKEKVETSAGVFDCIRVDSVFVSLDGKETDCTKSVWYAKEKGRVRELKRYKLQQGKERQVVEELVEIRDYTY